MVRIVIPVEIYRISGEKGLECVLMIRSVIPVKILVTPKTIEIRPFDI